MPLDTRLLDISLATGIDTKTEQKLVPPNKSLVLENAVVVKTGEIQKRNGYDLLSNADNSNIGAADSNIIGGNSIHSYNGQLLLVGYDGYTASYGGGMFAKGEADSWMNCGSYTPVTYDVELIGTPINTGFTDSLPSHYQTDDYKLLTYTRTESQVDVQMTLLDDAGVIYQENTQVDASASGSQAYRMADAYGDYVVVLSSGGGGLQLRYMDPTDKTSTGTAVTLLASYYFGTTPVWDAAVINYPAHTAGDNAGGAGSDGGYLDAYQEGVLAYVLPDNKIGIATFDTHGNIHRHLHYTSPKAKNRAIRVHVVQDEALGSRIFVFYQDNTTGYLDCLRFSPAISALSSAHNIFTSIGGLTVQAISAADDPQSGQGCIRVFADIANFIEDYNLVQTGTISFDGSTVTKTMTVNHSSLASNGFTYANKPYVLMTHLSGLQNTYFLHTYRTSSGGGAYPVWPAKLFYGLAGGRRGPILAQVNQLSADKFSIACTKLARFYGHTVKELQNAIVTFNMNPDALQSVNIGPTLLVGGGIVTGFDGKSQELGFHLYPENVYLGASQPTGGGMGDGYRSYRAVYSWVDRNGEIYRSAPSEAVGNTLTGGTNTQLQAVNMPYLTHTDAINKTNGYMPGRVEIYRTVAGGSIFYLCGNYQPNDYSDSLLTDEEVGLETDEYVSQNEILYTTGGVLYNIAPPASNILAVSTNRVFLVPMDDRQAVWFSKEKVQGIGIEFAEELQLRIEKGGNNTGLSVLDDKLIIFKEREIYYVAGDGPNDLGQGGFSAPRQISSDVGCVDSNSVVNIGMGVMFKSHKGIYMLDRSLQTTYIGAAVEAWNNYKVISAVLLEDKNQVRFTLDKGQGALCFDYLHGQWSRFTNHPAKDAVVHNGLYHWLKDDGNVRAQTEGFIDSNFVIPMKVRTSWIKLNGLQGFQRVRKASILGEYKSPHRLTINIFVDYDEVNPVQTITFDSADAISGNEALQYEIHLKRQKCQSIMFEIYDSSQRLTMESCSLTSVTLECGVKRGLNKNPKRKRK
jgi:hypothetical protein